jgi:hypothetical protein
MVGAPELFVILIVCLIPVGFLWGIIDAAMRPDWAFKAARQSKGLWIGLIVGTWVIALGWLLGWVYVLAIRPKVKRAQESGTRAAPRYS